MASPDFQLFTSLRYDPLLATLPTNTSFPSLSAQQKDLASPFYMATFHRDRILQAAEHFQWTLAASKIRGSTGLDFFLNALHETIDTSSSRPLRVRVLLSHDGELTVESNPTPAVGKWNLCPQRLPPPKATSSKIKMEVSPLTGGALTLGEHDYLRGDPETSSPWDILPDTQRTTPSPFTTFKTTSREMYTSARERVGIRDMAEKKEVLVVSEQEKVLEGSLTSVYFWRGGRWVTPPVEMGMGGQDGTTRRWAVENGLVVEGNVVVGDLKEGEGCWVSNGVRGFIYGVVKLNK